MVGKMGEIETIRYPSLNHQKIDGDVAEEMIDIGICISYQHILLIN